MSGDHVGTRRVRRVEDDGRKRDWLSRMPSGLRYALAIGANVAFFTIVGTAVFWFFQLGASSRTPEEASSFAERARAERTAARTQIDAPPLPIERATRTPSEPESDDVADSGSPSAFDIARGAAEPGRGATSATRRNAASAASADPRARAPGEPPPEEADDAADETDTAEARTALASLATPELRESDLDDEDADLAVDEDEDLGEDADETALIDEFEEDDEPIVDTSEPLDAEGAARAWAVAGRLAAQLENSYDCSSFALRSRDGGLPFIEGEVASLEDADLAEEEVERALGENYEIHVGLGCTVDLGGGYVALGDDSGGARLLRASQISAMTRAVLPEAGMCAALGHVVDAQPRLRTRLEVDDEPAVWVAEAAALRVCRAENDAWRVRVPGDDDAPAGAILYRGDILVAEAIRDAGASGGAAETPAPFEVRVASGAAGDDDGGRAPPPGNFRRAPETPEGLANARDVRPLSGPAPIPPDDLGALPRELTVTAEFNVSRTGQPSDITVTDAGTFSAPVIAAALRAVEASRFPPPEPEDGDAYRGRYEVRFAPDAAGEADAGALVDAAEPDADALGTSAALAAAASRRSISIPSGDDETGSVSTDTLEAARTAVASRAERRGQPVWVRRPSASDFNRLYPARARLTDQEGAVVLACVINGEQRLNCEVVTEEPPAWGFGRAALALSQRLIVHPLLADGSPAEGAAFELPFDFRLSAED